MTSSHLERIVRVENPIGRGKNHWLAHMHWRSVPLDSLIFDKPSHDGSPLDIARQIYHRLLARMVASGVHVWQTWLIVVAFALGFFTPGFRWFGDWGTWFVALVLGLGACGAIIFVLAPYVTRRAYDQNSVSEVRDIISRTFLRELPDETPLDLRDGIQESWLTLDGRPLSSELSAEDGQTVEARSRTLWWVGTGAAVGLAFLGAIPLLGYWASSLVGVIFAMKLLTDKAPLTRRAQELEVAEAVEGAAFVAAGGRPWGAIAEAARKRQIEEAIRDKSPAVELGTTTGLFAARGDLFGPNAGLPFMLSLRDLQMHLLVLGGTGSGKTSGILRPMAYQVGQHSGIGLVVLDGKGALPGELSNVPGMTVVDPARFTVSLVNGVEPDILVDTIREILSPTSAGGGDRFWVDSAAGLLRRGAIIARAAGGKFWCLQGAAKIAIDEATRKAAINQIPENLGKDPLLGEALAYFLNEWKNLDDKTKSGIGAQMRAWMSTITASADLLRWAKAHPQAEDVDITSALRGGRIGLLLPEYRYGMAGAVTTALLKARLFAGLKARADRGLAEGETPVVFVIDEAQEVSTSEDATMLAIGRSLELAVVAATQTVEGVTAKLGEHVTKKWLGIYGGVIALPGRSTETDAFVAARAGEGWKARINQVEGLTVRDAIVMSALAGPIAAARRQPHMKRVLDEEQNSFVQLPSRIEAEARSLLKQAGKAVAESVNARGAAQSQLGTHPLVAAGEAANLLAEPDTAIALVTRGRVPRRDVIRLKPVYPG